MKILFWQMRSSSYWDQIVLWDGLNTYWTEEMKPSSGYAKIHFNKWRNNSRFVFIGEL